MYIKKILKGVYLLKGVGERQKKTGVVKEGHKPWPLFFIFIDTVTVMTVIFFALSQVCHRLYFYTTGNDAKDIRMLKMKYGITKYRTYLLFYRRKTHCMQKCTDTVILQYYNNSNENRDW